MRLLVRCPAKINLFLAVGPRDERGYHPLRTIFQAVDLCDELSLEFGEQRSRPAVEVNGADLPEENTVTRALRLSREVFSILPARVVLTKRIPTESGLGGGSSDAAGLIRGLLAASGRKPADPSSELASIAVAVGMDVPFFLTGGRAKAEGYGERITPMPDAPEQWYVLVKPRIGCSTPEMYAKLDAHPREWRDWPTDESLYNDFEQVAPSECLDLIERLQALGANDAALSGSGSAVFGRFSRREAAEEVHARFAHLADTWLARSLTRAESLPIHRSEADP